MICSENEDDLHWMFHFNFLAVNIFHCSVQMRVMRFQREQMRSLLRVRSVVERGPETDVEEEKQWWFDLQEHSDSSWPTLYFTLMKAAVKGQ